MIKPYIIAEIGSNFDQSLSKAKKLITEAKKCNADAVKFQLFNPKILYPKKKDKKMLKIFKSIELKKKFIPPLIEFANLKKIDIFFSVFDYKNLKYLKRFDLKSYKIASSEVTNFKLVKEIIKTNKTVFISTGMSDIEDVKNILKLFKDKSNQKILMQCTSIYPTDISDMNLNVFKLYKKKFKGIELGLSDHSLSDIPAITAVGLGCHYFEKHFTLDKKGRGPDHFFAYNPKEFKKYVRNIRFAYLSLGKSKKEMLDKEKQFGRRDGIYATKNIIKGQKISSKNIFSKRPALGIRFRDKDKIISKYVAKYTIEKNQPVFFNQLKQI